MLRDEHPLPSQYPVSCHLARQRLSYRFSSFFKQYCPSSVELSRQNTRRRTTGIGPPSQAATSVSSAWYSASSFFSSSILGNRKKTSTAPSRITTIPARQTHWSPARNEVFA